MLLDLLKQKQLSQNTIGHDTFDADSYQEMKQESVLLQDTETSGMEKLKTFDRLLEDVFFSLYKSVPQLLEEQEVDKGYRFNRCQMSKFLETSQYNELRAYTELDTINSAMGAMSMTKKLIEEYQEDPDLNKIMQEINRAADAFNAAGEAGQAAANYSDMAQAAQQAGNAQMAGQYTKQAAEALARQEELDARGEGLAKSAANMMGQNQVKMRQAIRRAGEEAAAELQDVDDIVAGWGMGSGNFERMPMDNKIELMQKMARSEKFKRLAEIMGRYRNLSRAKQKEKLRREQMELHSISVGADLGRVLPGELMMVRHPAYKKEFQRKYLEKGLLQYDLKSKVKMGKGPIIILMDSSGSTRGRIEEFIKGTAMGLLDIALKEKRAFAAVFFASRQDPMKVFEFAPGEKDPEKVYELGTYFINGGTDFETPLNKAVELLEQSAYNKADVVMLTDGECRVSPEWLKAFLDKKKEREFNVYTVLMNVGRTTREAVDQFSDKVELVSDVLEDVAGEIFGSI